MILLDTQVLVWLAGQPERLSRPAQRAIIRYARSTGFSVASVTLVELAQMAARGRVRVSEAPGAWLRRLVSETGVVVKELTTDIAAVAAYLPRTFPSDPFDRVITATAIVERLRLVTSDRRIQDSGVVETIW